MVSVMDHVELRDTPEAQAWIEQFDAADRTTASLLLDSLILISTTELNRGILSIVEENLEKDGRPVALYAVRKAPKRLPPTVHREPRGPKYPTPYFDPQDDTIRPSAVASGAQVGSEGDLSHLVRDLARTFAANRVLDHPTVRAMRSTRCRRIMLVDDIIGSGKRTRDFVEWFCDHKTIRSWISLRYVQIVVIAYAGVDKQRVRLAKHRFVSRGVCHRILNKGRLFWSDDQRGALKRLCRKYAPKTSRPGLPLGFGEAFTCIVFEHKCPNTAPAILWAGKKGRWRALFKARPGLGESAWPVPLNRSRRDRRFLDAIGQERLSLADWQNYFSDEGRLRVLVLAAVAKKLRRPYVLSECLEVSVPMAEALLQNCRELGWIDAASRITAAGIRVLDFARKCGATREEDVKLKTDFYFPRSLRGARGSV